MNDKMILDVTCGDRTIWFQKNEPHTLYCDIRREEWEGDFGKTLRADGKKKHRHLVINPDIQCSFTDLPFEDNTFSLIVFDPPHIENLSENAWMRKSYGSLDGDWKPMIRKGFEECMRVLRVGGVLIFKWSDISVSTRNIINVIGQEPLFGHRSGKKMNTHWMTYMKFDTDVDRKTEPTISKMEQVDEPTTQTETQNSNLTFEKDECAKEYEELGLKELKELIEADRKTENNSEKPNNSTSSKMEQVEDETQKICKYCNGKCSWWVDGDCMNDDCRFKPKDEPQTNGYQTFNGTSVYVSRFEDEPRTDKSIGCSRCEGRFDCYDRDMPHAVLCNNYGKVTDEPQTERSE